ncbi:MAG TPA: PAS domain S-box protein [Gemmatimonadales bacterium]
MTRSSRSFLGLTGAIIVACLAVDLGVELWFDSSVPFLGTIARSLLRGSLLSLLIGAIALRGWRRDRPEPQVAPGTSLLRTAIEQLPVSVLLTDAQGHIEYVNPAFTKITGFQPEEVLGSTPRVLKSGRQDDAFYRRLWADIRAGQAWRGEVVNRRKDGTTYIQELVIQPVRNAAGEVAHFVGIGHDVTERRRAQEALEMTQLSMDQATDMILWVDADGRFTYANASAVRGFGYPPETLLALSVPDITSAVPRERWRETWEAARRAGSLRMEATVRRGDGSLLPCEVVVTHLEIGGKEFQCAIVRDLTERKQAERALAEQEAQWRALSEQSLTGIALIQDGDFVYVNPRLAEMFGFSPGEMIGLPTVAVVHPDDRAMGRESLRRQLSGELPSVHHLFKGLRKDGTVFDVELYGRALTHRGRPAALSTLLDISDRRRAAAALETQDKWFRSLIENSVEGIGLMTADTTALYLSPAFKRMLHYPVEEWLGRPLLELIHPDDLPQALSTLAGGVQAPGVPIPWQFRFRDATGAWRWMEGTAVNLIADPAVEGIAVNWRDVTDRKEAEEALQTSERRLRTLLDTVRLIVLGLDSKGRVDYVNPFFLQLTGYTREEVLGQPWIERFLPPGEQRKFQGVFLDLIEHNFHPYYQNLIVTKAGEERLVAWNNTVVRDPRGRATGTLSIGEDITEHRRLEAQFRQAQKMEAVGQLTGGIAHDFNNILMAIVGYTDFLLPAVSQSPAQAEDVQEIRKAADRATVLTRQLLAFSRRQVLVPQLLDLNTLVGEIGKMLRRLIGEDISFRTSLAEELGTVRADPGQLEQVIMNLVLNARDAMPAGGTLEIGTANVELDQGYVESHPYVAPGPYVSLWVTDSGIGISEEVKSHLFEPFFTTKPVGKGTGLGLATVYGIVKQSGGHVSAYSEVDEGSTFRIYLPRVDETAETIAPSEWNRPVGGQETILVVDDDDSVRALVQRVLSEHGYKVLAAAGPAAALEMVRGRTGGIDLLVTDVVMPGRSGRQLADEVADLFPGVRVLFMSGYTHDAIVHRGVLDPGLHFLSKPVSADVLLRTVRGLLDDAADRGS